MEWRESNTARGLMDTLQQWGLVLSQMEGPQSSTDRLVWVLTGACAFLLLVGVILFLMLRAAAWRE